MVDAVQALRLLEVIDESINEFKYMTRGMVTNDGRHPIDECLPFVEGARFALYAKYGKTMYEVPDGSIHTGETLEREPDSTVDKPHSEDSIPKMQ